jgi:glycosyltransferase A (GT-A) superfamily protein (DUF2064 family)
LKKKYAILIFSKPPIPGLVKTRLTTARGGAFTPEQAAQFFKRSLWDVTELACWCMDDLDDLNKQERANNPGAPEREYDLFISTTPASNVQLMKDTINEIGKWPREIHYMSDSGASFDDHFDMAMKEIFDQGYEAIVSIGADIPTLPRTHVVQAFQWLDYFSEVLGTPGFVQAPCQECGTSLVGFSFDTPINHQGIYYNMDGRPALDGYREKLEAGNIPNAYLTPVADVDEMEDLAHMLSCARALECAAKYQTDTYVPRRVLQWADYLGIRPITPPNDNHDPRQYMDDPDSTELGEDVAHLDVEPTDGHFE